MVQAKTTLSEINQNWDRNDSNALQYDSIICKLLSGINEVTYLLQNKNWIGNKINFEMDLSYCPSSSDIL